MPTYQYQCTECGEGLEAVQKFTDDALTMCPSCDGRLKKVFSAVGIVFKGSGFYRNDSRGSSSSSTSASSSTKASGSASSDSSSTGSASGSDTKSSASAPATASSSSSSSSSTSGTSAA
ncbi:FmdB family zinc ribbon protein [Streptomyces sp. NPDC088251]|uniref:FmdB family zinc ribbon protein n=1 Tax=unclassified Streptomyces TaxID=2593676 RepID=UPI0037F8A89E